MKKYVNGKYIEMTPEEIAELEAMATQTNPELEINELKQKLADTDYAVIKIAEGSATVDEYADLITQRREWRKRINELGG